MSLQTPGAADLLLQIVDRQARYHAASPLLAALSASPPPAPAARSGIYEDYRSAAVALLDLLRRHNETRIPQKWDLPPIAEPLVEHTQMEADRVESERDPARARAAGVGAGSGRGLPGIRAASRRPPQ
jgi:hypothetical protein